MNSKELSGCSPEIIGIDHGWSYIKTASDVFMSGVKEISTEPAFFDDVLEYKGKFYKIGTCRMEVKKNKVVTPEYYYLTLAAIAKELKQRGKSESRVIIAAGLPASRYGDEKKEFQNYLMQNPEVNFRFEGEHYHVFVEKTYVYPQCYPAVIDRLPMLGTKAVIVDIGSWTIDIVPILNRKPDESGVSSIPQGIITCMRAINKECMRQFGEQIDESEITDYMITRKTMLPESYQKIIDIEFKRFVHMILGSLREEQVSLMTTPVIFVGGGAVLMKNFGDMMFCHYSFNTDVKANAIGYETLAKLAVSKGGRSS